MRVKVEGGDFGAPVDVHAHGGVADGHALEIKFSALDDGVLVLGHPPFQGFEGIVDCCFGG